MISKLTTAIIEAWRLDAPKDPGGKAEEMSYIMQSIEAIRSTIQWCKRIKDLIQSEGWTLPYCCFTSNAFRPLLLRS